MKGRTVVASPPAPAPQKMACGACGGVKEIVEFPDIRVPECRPCRTGVVREFDVEMEHASFALAVSRLVDWYGRQLRSFGARPRRFRGRALLLACGVPIHHPAPDEEAMVETLRSAFPALASYQREQKPPSLASLAKDFL